MACECVTSTPIPPLLNHGYEVYYFNVSVAMAHIMCVLKVATISHTILSLNRFYLVLVELGPQPARGAFSVNLAVRLIAC